MLSFIAAAIFFLVIYWLYIYIFKAYFQILAYKKQFGKRIEVGFIPIFGLVW